MRDLAFWASMRDSLERTIVCEISGSYCRWHEGQDSGTGVITSSVTDTSVWQEWQTTLQELISRNCNTASLYAVIFG